LRVKVKKPSKEGYHGLLVKRSKTLPSQGRGRGSNPLQVTSGLSHKKYPIGGSVMSKKYAICAVREDGSLEPIMSWEGELTLSGDKGKGAVTVVDTKKDTKVTEPITGRVEVEPQMTANDFEVGDLVTVNGKLYQGEGEVAKIDGDNIVVAFYDREKKIRYSAEDIASGMVMFAPDDADEDDVEENDDNDSSEDNDEPKFNVGERVLLCGDLYQGEGTVKRLDGEDVIVSADNGKTYRYHPEDIVEGKIALA
jgi:hypothetical protein